jgi:hypothetical protein
MVGLSPVENEQQQGWQVEWTREILLQKKLALNVRGDGGRLAIIVWTLRCFAGDTSMQGKICPLTRAN